MSPMTSVDCNSMLFSFAGSISTYPCPIFSGVAQILPSQPFLRPFQSFPPLMLAPFCFGVFAHDAWLCCSLPKVMEIFGVWWTPMDHIPIGASRCNILTEEPPPENLINMLRGGKNLLSVSINPFLQGLIFPRVPKFSKVPSRIRHF